MSDTLNGKVPVFEQLVDMQHQFIHGDEDTTIPTDNGPVPSIAKALKDGLNGAGASAAAAAINAAAQAQATRIELEDRIYPGVYSTPPTNKPHSGEPSAAGDRCVILVDGVPFEHVRVGGGWLIPNIDAQMLASTDGASRVGTIQSGAGAVPRNTAAKLKEIGKTPQDFWLATDPDWTNAFERWALAGGNHIPDGNYVLKRQITTGGSRSVRIGNVVLDFSQATDPLQFPNSACFYADAGALTRISNLAPPPAAAPQKGSNTLSFVSAPAVQRGDVLIIYNPAESSWSGHRPYYRAGEFVEVDSVTGTTVRIFGSLYDTYVAADVQVYLMPRESFSLTGGRLRVIGTKAAGMEGVAATKFNQYRDLGLDNLAAGASLYASLAITRCYNVHGAGLDISQANDVAAGTDYGVVFGNSQKVRLFGKFAGGRHAVTTGGDNQVCSVPCRDGVVTGMFSNSAAALGGIGAANCHGNTEFWTYDGVLDGGFSGGGNHITIKAGSTLISRVTQSGIAILLGEMVGCDFTFAGVSVVARGNPSSVASRSVVDLGTNSDAIGPYTKYGGTLDFSNMCIDAPDADRGLRIVNRGCVAAEPISIKFAGMQIQRLSVAPVFGVSIGAPLSGGKAFDIVDLRGAVMPAVTYTAQPFNMSGAAAPKVRGWSRSGSTTGVASTSVATLAIPVVYDALAPVNPRNVVTLDRGRAAGQSYDYYVSNQTVSGFTINIYTTDGTNFVSAFPFSPSWTATVEQ